MIETNCMTMSDPTSIYTEILTAVAGNFRAHTQMSTAKACQLLDTKYD